VQIPVQVTFEGGLAASPALLARIEREAAKLERFHDRITSCRVAVIGRGHRRRQGDLYAVRLQITGPGDADVVIDRNPPADHAHALPAFAEWINENVWLYHASTIAEFLNNIR
jgi:hypothetical protein